MRNIWFVFIVLFAVIKDAMDIIGNLLAAVGGNVLSMFFDVICIVMIVLLTLIQRGELKSFFDFSRQRMVKAFGWILELIPIATDLFPFTLAIVVYDHIMYIGSEKQKEALMKKEEKAKEKAKREEEKESSEKNISDTDSVNSQNEKEQIPNNQNNNEDENEQKNTEN